MNCLTEAMGMSLPSCGTAPAVTSEKRRIAFASGERIVELIKKNVTPRKILTKAAFENAITVDLALGGSSNTVLHVLAVAHEAGVNLGLETFDKLSRTTLTYRLLSLSGIFIWRICTGQAASRP